MVKEVKNWVREMDDISVEKSKKMSKILKNLPPVKFTTAKHYNPAYFLFPQERFNQKAKLFQFEINQLTHDILKINYKIQMSAALCEWNIQSLDTLKRLHLFYEEEYTRVFLDLIYHIENFSFRIAAHRDKLCQFINFALELGYDEKETSVGRILNDKTAKKALMDTEIKKFGRAPLNTIIEIRKQLTHRRWYAGNIYQSLGVRSERIKLLVKIADKAVRGIFGINIYTIAKTIKYFKSKNRSVL